MAFFCHRLDELISWRGMLHIVYVQGTVSDTTVVQFIIKRRSTRKEVYFLFFFGVGVGVGVGVAVKPSNTVLPSLNTHSKNANSSNNVAHPLGILDSLKNHPTRTWDIVSHVENGSSKFQQHWSNRFLDEFFDHCGPFPEEKLRIATHFILKSPNGEVDDVIRDVRKLLGNERLLSKSQLESILREYFNEQMFFALSPESSQQVLVCKQAQQQGSPDIYPDPFSKKCLKFDNFSRSWSVDKSKPKNLVSRQVEEYRQAIEQAVQTYAESVFCDTNKYGIGVHAQSNGDMTVHISAKNMRIEEKQSCMHIHFGIYRTIIL
jgi:hypothetical protein